MTAIAARLKDDRRASPPSSRRSLRGPAAAFCGFYVAKADSKLFNKSSKVVLARDGETTAITMASDYEGEPKEFAVVIPVPTFIERKQIGVVEMKTIDHLDAFTAPRLVEYHDPDPCAPLMCRCAGRRRCRDRSADRRGATRRATAASPSRRTTTSANTTSRSCRRHESDGLVNWLTDNGYRIPAGADAVLGSYIKQKMRFFVAKVNLDRMQLARRRLPAAAAGALRDRRNSCCRCGSAPSTPHGPQDLIIFALTQATAGSRPRTIAPSSCPPTSTCRCS